MGGRNDATSCGAKQQHALYDNCRVDSMQELYTAEGWSSVTMIQMI
jgi:hypothetical protein